MKRKKSKDFSLNLKRDVWAKPCVVCGIPYEIKCDHIVPKARGGGAGADNVQPLCKQCNHKKGHRLVNAQLVDWVKSRGLAHFLAAVYTEDTKYQNSFDGPEFSSWCENSTRVAEAHSLYEAFLAKCR